MNTHDEIQVHIVNSVKGGCGKTAFSLFTALELAYQDRDENLKNKKDAAIIWIDADFRGTASKTLFYGETKQEFDVMQKGCTIEELQKRYSNLFEVNPFKVKNQLCFDSKYVEYTINDYLKGNISELDKMIVHGYAFAKRKDMDINPDGSEEPVGCINGLVDFIFSSLNIKDKQEFSYENDTSTVTVGHFIYLMRSLFAKILEIGRMDTKSSGKKYRGAKGYKHIIIDMPPGDDVYSDALMRVIREFEKEKEYPIKVNLYTLTTSDRGHIGAMVESVQDTCNKIREHNYNEEVFVVLSETRENEFGKKKISSMKEIDRRKECQEQIEKIDNGGRPITVMFSAFQREYYEFCRDIDTKEFGYVIGKG